MTHFRIALAGLALVILSVAATRLGKVPLRERILSTKHSGSFPLSLHAGPRELRSEQNNLLSLKAAYGKLPLSFEANEGQSNPQVKFLSHGNGYSLFLTSNEAVISFHPEAPPYDKRLPSQGRARTTSACPARNALDQGPRRAESKEASLRMQLVGATTSPRILGTGQLSGKVNYFLGNDPARWRTNIPTYTKAKYEAVYPGVDLIYYGNQHQLEYDFVIAPGANPNLIKFELQGADTSDLDAKGDIVLSLSGEEIRLHKPIIYQGEGNSRRVVRGHYVRRGSRLFGFQVAEYDRSHALVIDPVLSYSTLLGGSDIGHGNGIAVDTAGNAYAVGVTESVDFPAISAFQPALRGRWDAFIAKLNPAGTGLVYSTYIGGLDYDEATGIAVDSAGNAYVAGRTSSSDFPTKNPIQSASAGNEDAFVLKVNATGDTLQYSTR
jgi:hypothetical protein